MSSPPTRSISNKSFRKREVIALLRVRLEYVPSGTCADSSSERISWTGALCSGSAERYS
jgi:hypothetical protein